MATENPEVVRCLDTATLARLAQVNRSTLDYWIRTRLVSPSLRKSPGKRRTRLWTLQDAIVVRTIAGLRESGASLQKVRKAKRFLEKNWEGLSADSHLVWDGSDIRLVDEFGDVVSLVKDPGQQAFQLVTLPVGQWLTAATREAKYVRKDNLSRGIPATTPLEASQAIGGRSV